MVLHWWYVIFSDGYIDRQIKTPTELHKVFHQIYGKLHKRNADGMKQIKKNWHALSVYKSIEKFITDRSKIYQQDFFQQIGSIYVPISELCTDRLGV